MSKFAAIFRRALLILATVWVTGASVYAQQSKPVCGDSNPDPQSPDYKVGHYWGKPLAQSLALISVEPKFFVNEKMAALGRELNRRFCKEKQIEVVIFDDPRATDWDPIHLASLVAEAQRGLYYFDRSTGEENIRFSTKRGRDADRFINLGTTKKDVGPRIYRGAYTNYKFDYSVHIPLVLSGVSEVPKELESGIQLALSSNHEHYIWLGAISNDAPRGILRGATLLREYSLSFEGFEILSVSRRLARLGTLKAERMTIKYRSPESGAIRVQDLILGMKSQRDDVGIVFTIEMRTNETDYSNDSKIFDQLLKSWRLKTHVTSR
ncbi:MAG TPA: hypothetical protein VN643_03435 [Pyrinomonadaceae bacterium]|nr:hypothetical protein [Pyrinomonadaceae bacterium]